MTDVVNVGASANDGTGAPLRSGAQAINAKFAALDTTIANLVIGVMPDESVTAAKLAPTAITDKLGYVPSGHVANIAALQALDPTKITCVYVRAAGRAGTFVWKTGDYSAAVALDTLQGIYVKATSTAASSGAWVRQFSFKVESAWFGAVGDNTTDDGPALDAGFAMAILVGAGYVLTGSTGSTFKRTTAQNFDLAGTAQTAGMIIEGLGNQRTIINVRTVATNPQAKIFSSGGFVGVTITSLSGTGTTATAVWSNSTTPPVGGTLEIAGCSTAGYNGSWTILTSGPGTATFSCTATGTPATKGTATQRVIQANARFVNFGIAGNINGRVLEIGSHDFSDQLNRNYYDLTVTNDTNNTNAVGIEVNANYHCYGIMNSVLGGTITGGSAAVKVRKAAFCDFSVGGGNAYYGLYLTDDYVYGNAFRALDSEIVTIGVNIDSANVSQNTIYSGTLGYSSNGCIASAGSRNRFIGVNRNSAQPFFNASASFRVGVQLDDGDEIGYNGLNSFGNEYRTGSVLNSTIVSGGTLAAPADGICRTVIWTTAGTAASLTITLPSSPETGRHVEFFFINAVTTLTVAGGTALGGNPTTVAAQSLLSFTYIGGQWCRF